MTDESKSRIPEGLDPQNAERPSDIAIVGMSALFPGAPDVRAFWRNTLRGTDTIVEIPSDRWDWRTYYDTDPKAPDKVISKWGGFVPDLPFDPLHYGMPPTTLNSIEPVQLLLLEVVRAAIGDAGYDTRPFARERTAVVLGMGGGSAQVAMGYAFRSYLPMLDAVESGRGQTALQACEGLLPEWTEDSFPGFLLNVAAGRVANRFDLCGANYTVDAACGSSLAAANLAVRELEVGAADVVILAGADTVQNPFTYLAFSKTQAFSPRGRCRPFDASADGIVISEGVAALILKRRVDAERDGDRIYALIQGIGSSSDGRSKGLTAPNPDGQRRALRRAYSKAGVEPKSIGYVECHGTGTAVGDVVEVGSLIEVFREAGAEQGSCAIGSVKSQIGHTKCAAGMAGLINATLALHHRVLPPTIGVETPNPKVDLSASPFHISTMARPWLHSLTDEPRRAGVSAFGFGGTNFHTILQEYRGSKPVENTQEWPAELLRWTGSDASEIIAQITTLIADLKRGARPPLRDFAHTLALHTPQQATLAIVASSHADLEEKLVLAQNKLERKDSSFDDPKGLVFESRPRFDRAKVAFLFPGQGSQRPDMLLELALNFPQVRASFDAFDQALVADGTTPIGPRIFPPPAWTDLERDSIRHSLRPTELAQPALGIASVAMLTLLESLDFQPDMLAGHSYGELVALYAAGAMQLQGLAGLSAARGRLVADAIHDKPGAMAAITASREQVVTCLNEVNEVVIANHNSPQQTVIAGPATAIERALEKLKSAGIRSHRLAVAGAFHTQAVATVKEPLRARAISALNATPTLPVYSNLDASPYPDELELIAERLGEHVAKPVEFVQMIEAMYADGARVFVEVGPGGVLTSLVQSILGERPHLATATDSESRPGVATFLLAIARLVAAGLAIDIAALTRDRQPRELDLDHLPVGDGSPPLSASTWLVNGSRAKPIGTPEPRRLGQKLDPPPSLREVSRPTNQAPTIPTTSAAKYGPHRNGTPMTSPAPSPSTDQTTPKASVRAGSSDGSEAVLLSFQETMRTFLDVQRSTMVAYLGTRPAPLSLAGVAPVVPLIAKIASPIKVASEPKPVHESQKAPVAPAVMTPVVSSQFNREQIIHRLIEIVQDRTGYPAEMLELTLDLEADLGIDSIKRVEILGTLRDTVPGLELAATDAGVMEGLSRARTLGAIVDRVVEASVKDQTPVESPARRLIIESIEAPRTGQPTRLAPGGLVLITDDGRGVAEQLRQRLEDSGHPVRIVKSTEVDLTSPATVESLVATTRAIAPIAGLIHTLPLRGDVSGSLDLGIWRNQFADQVKGLFLLAKSVAPDLQSTAQSGGACLLAATSLVGLTKRRGDQPCKAFAGQGGVAGLVKTLARECPEVLTRVIDFEATAESKDIADHIHEEIRINDGWSEICYSGMHRSRLQVVSRTLPHGAPSITLKPSDSVVITGGARGISAAIAEELALRWKPTLLLIGASPAPSEQEDPETAYLTTPSQLKASLLAQMKRQSRPFGPADLEIAYQSLRRAREIRATLGRLRALGSTAEYARADVRDTEAMSRVLRGWRASYGDPAGIIHGAGVIQDKLLKDKNADSFDQVLFTKVEGAINLTHMINPQALKFAAFFSSIAGRFGNAGQSDYAAANEVLNKLALWLDQRWPCRILSAIWGPWSQVGMVSDLEAHLGRQGLGMIPPEFGRRAFVDELEFGQKETVEVLFTGLLGTLEHANPIKEYAAVEPRR